MAIRIDSHQHFWRIEQFDTSWMVDGYDGLRRDFLPTDLEPHLRAHDIQKTVFVQTQHVFEDNAWVFELAERHPWIAGVVAWIDPTADAQFEARLIELQRNPLFCGVRHLTHNEPADDFILRDDVRRSLRVLERHRTPFDLLFFPRHLRHATTLATQFPDLPLVIDHLAKPAITKGSVDPHWRRELRAAAEHRNVFCKLSGMVTEADLQDWQPADLEPFVHEALDAFGSDRCMFGSDWPVCEAAATYSQVFSALDGTISSLSARERDDVLGGTAARFYSLAE